MQKYDRLIPLLACAASYWIMQPEVGLQTGIRRDLLRILSLPGAIHLVNALYNAGFKVWPPRTPLPKTFSAGASGLIP